MSTRKRLPHVAGPAERPEAPGSKQDIVATLLGIQPNPPSPRVQELKKLGKSPEEIQTILEAELWREAAEKPPIDEILNGEFADIERSLKDEVFSMISLWVDERKKKPSKRQEITEWKILTEIENRVLLLRQILSAVRSTKTRETIAAHWREMCLENARNPSRKASLDDTSKGVDSTRLPPLSSAEIDWAVRLTFPKQIEQELDRLRKRPGRRGDPVIDRLWLFIHEQDQTGASDKKIAALFRKKNPRLGERLRKITAQKVAEVRANRLRREQNRK